jgi:hypothetical protein
MRCKRLVAWLPGSVSGFFVAPDELWAATYIARRTALQIWQVSDSIMISTNTHPIRTLTWVVSTSLADAANGPLARVNICGIVSIDYDETFSPVTMLKSLQILLVIAAYFDYEI